MVAIAFALVVVIFVFAFPFALNRQREVYEQLVRTLENDRDAARQESKVFRGLLFPVINRAEAASEGAAAFSPGASSTPGRRAPKAAPLEVAAPKTVEEIWRLRVPYREKFKLLRQLSNSKQQRTDALASALKQQEKTHVVSEAR